ncbi:MAG: pyridoxamine 5'-phosphate oxidase family protein [Syntrophomonadaceae bacterium]|nr:pyridoxamine 5'-phosphate oxidase family protein [Syntrophomonadaceae bacterium]
MGKALSERLPANIYNFFQSNTMTGVASTIDDDDYPRGAPMSLFYALDDRTLVMGTQNGSQTFKNAERSGKIALTFFNEGDIAFSLRGRVWVFKRTMESSKYLGILVVEIEAVKSDVAVDVEVSEGIKIKYRSPKWEDFINRVLKELRRYTLNDIRDN